MLAGAQRDLDCSRGRDGYRGEQVAAQHDQAERAPGCADDGIGTFVTEEARGEPLIHHVGLLEEQLPLRQTWCLRARGQEDAAAVGSAGCDADPARSAGTWCVQAITISGTAARLAAMSRYLASCQPRKLPDAGTVIRKATATGTGTSMLTPT